MGHNILLADQFGHCTKVVVIRPGAPYIISKIKDLLNRLNFLNAQIRGISKLSLYFSLKFLVC